MLAAVLAPLCFAQCNWMGGPGGGFEGIGGCQTDGNCGITCGLVGIGAQKIACHTNGTYCCKCVYQDNTYECNWNHSICIRRVQADRYALANSECVAVTGGNDCRSLEPPGGSGGD